MRWLGLIALIALGCGPQGPVKAALYGDLPSLQREIARAERAGKLDSDAVVELAEAVAAREVASAEGPAGARRVRALRACARPLLTALRERSDGQDDVAAEAMLIRLAHDDVEPESLLARHRAEQSGAWRAVAARAAVDPRDVLVRRGFFLDADQRVRRAALEAALDRPDASDRDALLEAFRLDPDPLSRSLAARAAGAIGGEASVLGLKDRFARADEQDRLAVIDAWAMPAALGAGGARELRSVAEGEQGMLSLAATYALIRTGDQDGSLVGLLLGAIEHGTEAERRFAMSVAPSTDARVMPALVRAAKDENLEVRVIALARLLDEGGPRVEETKKALRELAARKSGVAAEARAALAAAGDRSVVPALSEDARRGHPFRRQNAALALVRLGEAGKAAVALGDPDPGVRIAVSCGVLARAR